MLTHPFEFNITFSTPKKKNQHKRQLSQLNESLNDFVVGYSTIAGAIRKGTFEPQTNGHSTYSGIFAGGESSASSNQVLENRIEDKIRKEVDTADMIVENGMHDAILTAMDNVVIP